MKKLILSILFTLILCIGAFAADTVYVNGVSGSDSASGTSNSPFATLQKALDKVVDGGTIVVLGDVTLNDGAELSSESKATVSTNGSAKINVSGKLYINAPLTFENVNLAFAANIPMIFCEGNNVTFGEGIVNTFSGYAPIIYGGTYAAKSGITQSKMRFSDYTLTVKSGTWYYVKGGSFRDGEGQPVGTLKNVTLNILGGTFTSNKKGTGDNALISPTGFDALEGTATLNISGGTFGCSIVGVSRPGYNSSVSNNQYVHGNISINISGGTFNGGDIRAVQDAVASEIDGDFFLTVSGGSFSNFGIVDAASVNGLAVADVISGISTSGFAPLINLSDTSSVKVTNGALIRISGAVNASSLSISGDKKVIIEGVTADSAINFDQNLFVGTNTEIKNIALNGYGEKVLSCSDGKITFGENISGSGIGLKNFTDATVKSGLYAYIKGARDKDVKLHIDGATVSGDVIASTGENKTNGFVLVTSGTLGGNIYAFENCGNVGAVQILGGTHEGKIGATKYATEKSVDIFGAYSATDGEIDYASVMKYNAPTDAVFVTNELNLAAGQVAGDGSSPLAPMTDLAAAVTAANGEKQVVICGPIYLTSTLTLPKIAAKTVITSKYMGIDYRDFADARIELSDGLRISSETVIENVTFLSVERYTFVSAEGNKLTIGEGVECKLYSGKRIEQYPTLVGGSHAKTDILRNVNLTVKSGTWGILSGASYHPSDSDTTEYLITGSVYVYIHGGTFTEGVYLAGRASLNDGARLYALGGLFECSIYGSHDSDTTIKGHLRFFFEGGEFHGDISRSKDGSAVGKYFTINLAGGNFDRVSTINCAGGNLNISDNIDLDAKIVGNAEFTNPIAGFADPSVVYHDGYYYYTFAKSYLSKPAIYMAKAANLCDIGNVEPFIIWAQATSGEGSDIQSVWAPQLYLIDGNWYVYTTCDVGMASSVSNRRMPRIWKCSDGKPDGSYTYIGTFTNLDTAIESYLSPRIINYGSKMYLVCGGFYRAEDCTNQHIQRLFACELSNATTMATARSVISTPQYSYEDGIMEGPFPVISPNGTLYLLFAAGHTRTDEYCTGILRFNGTESDSLLNESKWEKSANPLHFVNYENGVYSPGAMVITTSPSGDKYIAVYHAKEYHYSAYTMRRMYMQELTFVNDFPTVAEPQPTSTVFEMALNEMPLSERIIGSPKMGTVVPSNYGPYYGETVYHSNALLSNATLLDALRATKFFIGIKVEDFDFVRCDFDKDGKLGSSDILNIIKLAIN